MGKQYANYFIILVLHIGSATLNFENSNSHLDLAIPKTFALEILRDSEVFFFSKTFLARCYFPPDSEKVKTFFDSVCVTNKYL